MADEYRDDCPTAFSLVRRDVVFGGLSVVGGAAVSMLPEISVTAWSQESSAQFMEISSLLIPHRLRQEVGKRIGAAMSALNPSLSAQIAELLAIAKKHDARIVEDF